MDPASSLSLFVAAAIAEIGGAWLVWQGVREHRGWLFIGAGVIALGIDGFVATLQPDADVGRILAAYGGVFVAGSLAWGWPWTASSRTDTTSPAPSSASSESRSSCRPRVLRDTPPVCYAPSRQAETARVRTGAGAED